MKAITKKLLAILLTLCVLVSGIATAYASGGEADYAIYQDSSSATVNAYTYMHAYEYSTVGDDAKALPAGNFTVTMDVYALTEGTLAYKAIGLVGDSWVDRTNHIFWSAGSQDLNKWVTATFSGSITDVAKIHELIYIAGFNGYVDNITVKSGNTEIFKLSFAESHLGKYGHGQDPNGPLVALPEDIVEAKNIDA